MLSNRTVSVLKWGRCEVYAAVNPKVPDWVLNFSPLPSLSSPHRNLSAFPAAQSEHLHQKMSENGTLPLRGKVLTVDTMNANVKKVDYAVRGPIVQRAVQIEKELKEVRAVFITSSQKKYCIARKFMLWQVVNSANIRNSHEHSLEARHTRSISG